MYADRSVNAINRDELLDKLRTMSDKFPKAPDTMAAINLLYSARFFGPFETVGGEFVVQMTPDVVRMQSRTLQVRHDYYGAYGIVRIAS